MAKPHKKPKDLHERVLAVRLTDAEFKRFSKIAEIEALPIATLARRILMRYLPGDANHR